jgi:predicted nucleic acid-binding protein
MRIIIDTNIFISALIRDSLTREIILFSGHEFLMPEIIFKEIEKHESLIVEKSGLSKGEIWELIEKINKYVNLVDDGVIRPYIYDALRLMGEIDEEDALFISCGMAYPDSLIWSDDKDFKKQNKIKIVTTEEILNILEK